MDLEKGLGLDEVQKRLKEYGYNEVPEKKKSRTLGFFKKFWGVTPWMLEITAGLEGALGKFFEMYVVIGLIVFNAILGFLQEERANAALELLKEKLKVNARVKRNGNWILIPARELVPGDVIRLRAGDFIPADSKVAEGNVGVDQSSLTGESQMIEKKANEVLYGGSIVRRGEVTGIVTSTGTKTYFGRTVELVQVAKPKLHMEEVTSRVVKWLVIIVSSFLSVALVFTAVKGMSLIGILPLAVVLMVSAIPVALPTMFTISMALGSLELMKKGILITRLSAIEDAATMNIVCADKTGTMTMNKLSVEKEMVVDKFSEKDVILYGALASQEANQDPIDLAFLSATKDSRLSLEGYLQKKFVPFDPSTRRTEAIIEKDEKQFFVLKGAVNTIVPLCKNSKNQLLALEERGESLSAKGYRAIAVAQGTREDNIELVGVAFLYDKPRADSSKLIRELKDLGLNVKMLTGDALPIAKEVAKELGLGNAITRTSDLKKSTEDKISKLVEESDGFAEIYPEDKFLIVKSLQKGRHIVGMTGDGVNDAPALRQAEVGIAVSNATDVAKKAASAVLTTEGLEGIVDLVKMGRMTYQRILTWILNKVIKTFQITVFVVLAFLLTGQYIISALHMILLLFLTDFVTLSISTDNVRYSGRPDTWNITGLVKVALFLGILVIAELMFFLYIGSSYFGLFSNVGQLHTFTFQMLIYVELLDLLIIRERKHFWNSRPSQFLLLAIAGDLVLVFLISVLGLPGIAPITPAAALSVVVLSVMVVCLINDTVKVALVKRFWQQL
ncbi:MAG: plasma-membrane proton-efflux P-type ATPase [Thermodesulfobacteriota bacterium]|jgi:H+-transporting ATPase